MKKISQSFIVLVLSSVLFWTSTVAAEQPEGSTENQNDVNYYFEELIYQLNQDDSLNILKEKGVIYLEGGKVVLAIKNEAKTDTQIASIVKKIQSIVPSEMLEISLEDLKYSNNEYEKLSEDIKKSLEERKVEFSSVTFDAAKEKIIAKVYDNSENNSKLSEAIQNIAQGDMLEVEYLNEQPTNEEETLDEDQIVTTENDINYYYEELVYQLNQSSTLDPLKEKGIIYLDHGIITIGLKKGARQDPEVAKALELSKEIVPPNMLKIITEDLKYSSGDYKKLSEETYKSLESKGIKNLGVTFNVVTGKIIVKVHNNENARNNISDNLKNVSNSSMLEVEYVEEMPENERSRASDYNNMAGGIALSRDPYNFTLQPWCTVAGTASKGSERYVITAGHCFDDVSNQAVYQYGQFLGRVHATNMSYDVSLVKIDPTYQFTGGRWVSDYLYEYDAYDGSYKGYSTPEYGMKLCKSGITTNKTCGTVSSYEVYRESWSGDGSWVFDIEGGSVNLSEGGDSGAPWYSGYSHPDKYLYGIHKGGGGNDAYAVRILDILRIYGITLYTSDSPTKVTY